MGISLVKLKNALNFLFSIFSFIKEIKKKTGCGLWDEHIKSRKHKEAFKQGRTFESQLSSDSY